MKVIRHITAWLDETEVVGLKSSLPWFDWLLVLVHVMKFYGTVEVQLQLFLTSTMDESWVDPVTCL